MYFYIETLGCKVNAYESNFIKKTMLENGFFYTDKIIEADIIIVNTCTVTNTADSKCRKLIRKLKRENENAIFVVLGCSVQNNLEPYKEMNIPILLGNSKKSEIANIIKNYIETKENYHYIFENRDLEFEDMRINDFNHTRAFIKIEDGCDNFCTYCIIPFVRGKCRSKDFELIIKEANDLVKNGHQEIVLTGIHTGSYDNNGHDLVDVIKELAKINELKRIRLSSVEITELNDKFMNMLKDTPKFCDHLHIPLQAGSNEILEKMHRKYDLNYFENKIKEIRNIRPLIAITTDIIVGFPEETDEMFLSTYEFSKKIAFSKIHVFPYSKRDGTVASKMEQVDDSVKTKRVQKLLELSNMLECEYENKFINKEVEVLIEEVKENESIGHTSNYLKVSIKGSLNKNTMVRTIYKR